MRGGKWTTWDGGVPLYLFTFGSFEEECIFPPFPAQSLIDFLLSFGIYILTPQPMTCAPMNCVFPTWQNNPAVYLQSETTSSSKAHKSDLKSKRWHWIRGVEIRLVSIWHPAGRFMWSLHNQSHGAAGKSAHCYITAHCCQRRAAANVALRLTLRRG